MFGRRAAQLQRDLDTAHENLRKSASEVVDLNGVLTTANRARRTAEAARDRLTAEVADLHDQLAAAVDARTLTGSQEKMLLWLLENAPQEILSDPAAPRDACELALVTLRLWRPQYGKPAPLAASTTSVDADDDDDDEPAHRPRRRR